MLNLSNINLNYSHFFVFRMFFCLAVISRSILLGKDRVKVICFCMILHAGKMLTECDSVLLH